MIHYYGKAGKKMNWTIVFLIPALTFAPSKEINHKYGRGITKVGNNDYVIEVTSAVGKDVFRIETVNRYLEIMEI